MSLLDNSTAGGLQQLALCRICGQHIYPNQYHMCGGTLPQTTMFPQTAPRYQPLHPVIDWTDLLKQYQGWIAQQPPQLPDKFDAWVEEVRAQKRVEELLKCLCDHLLPKEGQE